VVRGSDRPPSSLTPEFLQSFNGRALGPEITSRPRAPATSPPLPEEVSLLDRPLRSDIRRRQRRHCGATSYRMDEPSAGWYGEAESSKASLTLARLATTRQHDLNRLIDYCPNLSNSLSAAR
jgi:hypothetical protein